MKPQVKNLLIAIGCTLFLVGSAIFGFTFSLKTYLQYNGQYDMIHHFHMALPPAQSREDVFGYHGA